MSNDEKKSQELQKRSATEIMSRLKKWNTGWKGFSHNGGSAAGEIWDVKA